MVQNQWLNLYLFDINNFTIYKLLYYLSGLVCPFLICINSLNTFTYYKFSNKKLNNDFIVTGKLLFITIFILLTTISALISSFIFLNYSLICNVLINDSENLSYLNFDKQILFVLILSILLIFNKIKLILKKIILINFFIISIIIWYSQLNNIASNDIIIFNNIFNIVNINFINILFLVSIEITYYLWSYISYGSNLSDWKLNINKSKFLQILKIIFFYLLIIVYYTILFK